MSASTTTSTTSNDDGNNDKNLTLVVHIIDGQEEEQRQAQVAQQQDDNDQTRNSKTLLMILEEQLLFPTSTTTAANKTGKDGLKKRHLKKQLFHKIIFKCNNEKDNNDDDTHPGNGTAGTIIKEDEDEDVEEEVSLFFVTSNEFYNIIQHAQQQIREQELQQNNEQPISSKPSSLPLVLIEIDLKFCTLSSSSSSSSKSSSSYSRSFYLSSFSKILSSFNTFIRLVKNQSNHQNQDQQKFNSNITFLYNLHVELYDDDDNHHTILPLVKDWLSLCTTIIVYRNTNVLPIIHQEEKMTKQWRSKKRNRLCLRIVHPNNNNDGASSSTIDDHNITTTTTALSSTSSAVSVAPAGRAMTTAPTLQSSSSSSSSSSYGFKSFISVVNDFAQAIKETKTLQDLTIDVHCQCTWLSFGDGGNDDNDYHTNNNITNTNNMDTLSPIILGITQNISLEKLSLQIQWINKGGTNVTNNVSKIFTKCLIPSLKRNDCKINHFTLSCPSSSITSLTSSSSSSSSSTTITTSSIERIIDFPFVPTLTRSLLLPRECKISYLNLSGLRLYSHHLDLLLSGIVGSTKSITSRTGTTLSYHPMKHINISHNNIGILELTRTYSTIDSIAHGYKNNDDNNSTKIIMQLESIDISNNVFMSKPIWGYFTTEIEREEYKMNLFRSICTILTKFPKLYHKSFEVGTHLSIFHDTPHVLEEIGILLDQNRFHHILLSSLDNTAGSRVGRDNPTGITSTTITDTFPVALWSKIFAKINRSIASNDDNAAKRRQANIIYQIFQRGIYLPIAQSLEK